MGDLALEWLSGAGAADLAIVDDDLAEDDGLRPAALLSLFLDRRAEPGDALPAGDGDLRGWWGDGFAEVEGDRIGSRLWLLDRATRREDFPRRAEELAREALAWMLEGRVTDRIDVSVEVGEDDWTLNITIYRPHGDPITFRFAHAWDGEEERLRVPAPVNKPPIAAFTYDATTGRTVQFTDASNDDGAIVSRGWDFGDGSPTSSEQNPSHEYTTPGPHDVKLTVTDDSGQQDTFEASVALAVAQTHRANFERAAAQYAEISDAEHNGVLDVDGAFTLEAEIELASLPAINEQYGIASKWDATGNQRTVLFYLINSGGTVRLRLLTSPDGVNGHGREYQWNDIAVATLYRIAASFDPSAVGIENQFKIHVDGVQKPLVTVADSGTAIFQSAAPFRVGAFNGGDNNFDGKIGDLRLWSADRTTQQIADHLGVGLDPNSTDLSLYLYRRDNHEDLTANENHLTGVNGPTFVPVP